MRIDNLSGGLITTSFPHNKVHVGDAYFNHYSAIINVSASINIRFETGSDKLVHFEWEVDSSGAADIYFFEDTTFADVVGNRIVGLNRLRSGSNSSLVTICHTPSGSGDGTALGPVIYMGSGQQQGGVRGARKEIILKSSSAYLMRVTSQAASNRVTVLFDWYEHESHE